MDGPLAGGAPSALQRLLGPELSAKQLPVGAKKDLWLDAWNDSVAGINAYTSCVATCDLYSDGDYRLIVADASRRIKVWRGTNKANELPLGDVPSALAVFIPELTTPRMPALAVASAQYIYIYRNLRPYFKFTVPSDPVNADEAAVWAGLASGTLTPDAAESQLHKLQDGGTALTDRSHDLISLKDSDSRASFVERCRGEALAPPTIVTCLTTCRKSIDEPGYLSSLIAGVESGKVLVLVPAGTSVARSYALGSSAVPAFISASGLLDGEHRIAIAARDGCVYVVRDGSLQRRPIPLESQAVGLCVVGSQIVVACMNDTLHCYTVTGQKVYSVYFPASVSTMQAVNDPTSKLHKCVLVGLATGEVRLYSEKRLVASYSLPAPATALCFGRYNREDNTLIAVTRAGALNIKILSRTANVESSASGPPPEQDVPLQVPKKTRLYVEQTQREREQAVDMHRTFQRDLCKLRLQAARAYVKVLTDGQGPASMVSSASVSLNAEVEGLGPRFQLLLSVKNEGGKPVSRVAVSLEASDALYALERRQFTIPVLVPGLLYSFPVAVRALQPDAPPGSVRVVFSQGASCLPLLSALVKMPLSEPDLY